MISSDERIDAANAMRDAAEKYTNGNILNALVQFLCIDFDGKTLWHDMLTRLAGFIDPTCEMTDASWDNGECTWGCICSACGAYIEHERGRFLDYCPRCGARVVSSDGASDR